jgi:3-dehydroquinate synthase
VRALHGDTAASGLAGLGLRVAELVLQPGEQTKALSQAEEALRFLAVSGIHRRDVVVALGGGVVGDLSGLVAALYHRGIAVVQMPTTVVAQVDAAIGGKTGVNLPEGKNLVGAFHQPLAVLADTDALATLPAEEFRAGLGEVVKHGLIADLDLLSRLESGPSEILERRPETLVPLVAQAAAVKARVVEQDETELGARAFLNYGHTLAHALEALGSYRAWRHGEAVSVGIALDATYSHLAGLLAEVDWRRVLRAIRALGLPLTAPQLADPGAVLEGLEDFREHLGGELTITLLAGIGRGIEVHEMREAGILDALAALGPSGRA